MTGKPSCILPAGSFDATSRTSTRVRRTIDGVLLQVSLALQTQHSQSLDPQICSVERFTNDDSHGAKDVQTLDCQGEHAVSCLSCSRRAHLAISAASMKS